MEHPTLTPQLCPPPGNAQLAAPTLGQLVRAARERKARSIGSLATEIAPGSPHRWTAAITRIESDTFDMSMPDAPHPLGTLLGYIGDALEVSDDERTEWEAAITRMLERPAVPSHEERLNRALLLALECMPVGGVSFGKFAGAIQQFSHAIPRSTDPWTAADADTAAWLRIERTPHEGRVAIMRELCEVYAVALEETNAPLLNRALRAAFDAVQMADPVAAAIAQQDRG